MTRTSYVPSSAKIKVIVLGGAGCNAVTRMAREQIYGVEFIALNTDAKHLAVTEGIRQSPQPGGDQGIIKLVDKLNTMVIVPNDRLLTFHDQFVQGIEQLLKGSYEPEIEMPLFSISKIAA